MEKHNRQKILTRPVCGLFILMSLAITLDVIVPVRKTWAWIEEECVTPAVSPEACKQVLLGCCYLCHMRHIYLSLEWLLLTVRSPSFEFPHAPLWGECSSKFFPFPHHTGPLVTCVYCKFSPPCLFLQRGTDLKREINRTSIWVGDK